MAANLRETQAQILSYTGGRMAVSAVPGSGKTFILSRLAAQLIATGRVDLQTGQQVLVVTYLNASVDTFRARIANWLVELGLPPGQGYDVRTLHSLAREILLTAPSLAGVVDPFPILDEAQTTLAVARAVDGWIRDHPRDWEAFLPPEAPESPRLRARWRTMTEEMVKDFIRLAKNGRHRPEAVLDRLSQAAAAWAETDWDPQAPGPGPFYPLLVMLASIYRRYQNAVVDQGAMDFDDLVWGAVDLVTRNPDLVAELRRRWPFVLEDEAQDSVPLQELLLATLTGPDGNWVRVGDPNQAIMSTFTAANPRFFRAFLARPDVTSRPLTESGRSSRKIVGLANRLVTWTCHEHPVPEVQRLAFHHQMIAPTPPGDVQPNPPDDESLIEIRVYRHREDEELPAVAQAAWEHATSHPTQTVAILVPTNESGYRVAAHLDDLGAAYDELLRGGGPAREIAATLHGILGILAHPLDPRRLEAAFAALLDLRPLAPAPLPPDRLAHLLTILRSVFRPEQLLYPAPGKTLDDALPAGVASADDRDTIARFAAEVRRWIDALALPPDALVLAIADELFLDADDLANAHRISQFFRSLTDANPYWRLPDLVAQLQEVAQGRVQLYGTGPGNEGYEPQPGRISLTTQHRAKGMEWDTVFLVGIDSFWIPGHLDAPFMGVNEALGGDPAAEAAAQFRLLMEGDAGLLPGLDATQTAHVELIAERLRLLYVGITRARRNLYLSRSRAVSGFRQEQGREAATALGVLYHYLRELD
jgi:DNA helicase II / ATP-dependent DNA helicase PcrA